MILLNCENLLKPLKNPLHIVQVLGLRFQTKCYIHGININKPVRVRFAPSPTGSLHLGGLRTALFNYLLARKTGGSFVLRIEDTDRKRHVPGAVESILTTLRWASLDFDEGPGKDSPHGPFYQSERTELYRDYAARLIKEGFAYRCFCTSERLKKVREIAQISGTNVLYDRHCLSLDMAVIEENLANGIPHTIRLKAVPEGVIKVNDLVYGSIEVSDKNIDDAIILKSDGYPTYHLASVVDDHLMKITHVLRGEEWLTSTPKHVILYKSFGWEPPQFAHLPLLVNLDKTKLSKRSGDVSVENFMRNGYLPEAILNFVACLGWCPDTDKEIFTLKELILEFSPDQIGHSSASVLISKLDWLNKAHMKRKIESTEGLKELVKILKPLIQEKFSEELVTRGEKSKLDDEYLSKVILTIGDRIRKLSDISELCGYFFISPDYDSSDSLAFRVKIGEDNLKIISKAVAYYLKDLNTHERNNLESLKLCIDNVAKETGKTRDKVLMSLRYIITGTKVGAGVVETMCTLGDKIYMERINFFLNKFSE